ncbi:hypothetical protein PM022_18615 [Halorubrum ezzemoulense]|uniref:hypothetical protein n=1 Tax=Halorubrum ezzemoulense TaxID=337243 RepID=UPI00232C51A2|nr:hypothetical protein [Halorubrum ezzemoulense]MDB2276503.1 hypothetical protein [Halorubrum ezzemoulense]
MLHGSGTEMHNTGWIGTASTPSTQEPSEALAAICTEEFPDWYGIATGTLVLDTVGLAAVPTSRLVVREGAPDAATLDSLLRTILTRNHNRNVPTLCQLLVHLAGTDQYQVTARVAELGVPCRPLGRYGLASSLASPALCPIDRETPSEITSSRCLATDGWETSIESDYTGIPGLAASDGLTPASDAAMTSLQLRTSTHEFASLLAGTTGGEPYASLGVSPTMTLSETELEALVDVTPHYESCDWPVTASRFAPPFIRETIHSDAAGTDHESVLAGPQRVMTRIGVQDGSSITDFVDGWLSESGITHESVTDRSSGDPHFRGHPHDAAGPVAVVDPEADVTDDVLTSAGELIMAANRARRADAHLLVITPSEHAAEWARDVLTVPYVRRQGHTAQLYTVPMDIHTTRGDVVVALRESDPVYWTVSDTGRRAVYQGDRCLASGPVTEPIVSYAFEAPRVRKRDGSLRVVTPAGDVRSQFASAEALHAEYLGVPRPILPVRPLFCADVTVAARTGSSLREPPVPFNQFEGTNHQRRRDHHKRGLAEFLELYTRRTPTQRSADTSTAPRFAEQFQHWYDGQSTRSPPSRLRVADQIGQLRGRSEITDADALTRHSWWTPAESLPLALAHGHADDALVATDHQNAN